MKNKKILLIIIILIVLTTLIGYNLTNKDQPIKETIKENKEESNKEQPKEPSIENNEAIDKENVKKELLYIINNKVPFEFTSTVENMKDINNDQLLSLYFYNYLDLPIEPVKDIEVEEYFKTYLDIEITHEDVNCFIESYRDDINDSDAPGYLYQDGYYINNYRNNIHQHGGASTYQHKPIENYFNNFEIKDDKYIITINKLFNYPSGDTSGPNTAIYDNNFNFDEPLKELENIDYDNYQQIIADYDTMLKDVKGNIKDYQSTMTKYIYTFEKINNNYILISYEIY